MSCSWESYNNNLKKLTEKWNLFVLEEFNVAEFNKLYQSTLEITLDVSNGYNNFISS